MAPVVWRHCAMCLTFSLGVRFYTFFLLKVFPVPNDNYFLWEFVSRAVAGDQADRNDVSRPAVIDDEIATGGGGSMLLSRLGASSWYMWMPLGLPIDPFTPNRHVQCYRSSHNGQPQWASNLVPMSISNMVLYKGLLMSFPNRYTWSYHHDLQKDGPVSFKNTDPHRAPHFVLGPLPFDNTRP